MGFGAVKPRELESPEGIGPSKPILQTGCRASERTHRADDEDRTHLIFVGNEVPHQSASSANTQSGRRESNTHVTAWKAVALPIGHTRKIKTENQSG